MTRNRKTVELLAPAGNWEALEAAVEAGADAVYLGGKQFNMRLHRSDMNFDNAALKKAVAYTHAHDVRLYITINNLISDDELPALKEYLLYLGEIQPDAILVQDFAVLELVRSLGIKLPLHTSVMMNTHNEAAIERLKEYGITRIVVGREMTLAELALFRERTGIEVEYFIHGDMCISESGQCIHSGVLFGQSSNRGRCLKPCRWAYELIDEQTKEVLDTDGPGTYKLALKDMCMYRSIPELIQAGVCSFKIEGRMRPADFVRRIVTTYRRAIDRYLADPVGYAIDEKDWQQLYEGRARDFTTTFAFGQPDARSIGFDGQREPRFFSEAVKEAGLQDDILQQEEPIPAADSSQPRCLAVHVADIASLRAACENGATAIYIGGEAWRPCRPWTLGGIRQAIEIAHTAGARLIVDTPRTTMRRECGELVPWLRSLEALHPDGLLVSNLGSLRLAQETSLPLQADFSFNLFNHIAAKFLQDNGITLATASLELSFAQLRLLAAHSPLPLEIIVHGAYESMICDHNLPALSLDYDPLANPAFCDRRYALRDRAGEIHPIRMDQYGRNHILFAKDLCLAPYLEKFNGLASYRIEAQDYTAALTGQLTRFYRQALDNLAAGHPRCDTEELHQLEQQSPRAFGIGAYRFRISK